MFRTTIASSGSDYNWNSIAWNGIANLNTSSIGQGSKYIVNDVSMSIQNPERVVAATNDGLFLIINGVADTASLTVDTVRDSGPGPGVATYSTVF